MPTLEWTEIEPRWGQTIHKTKSFNDKRTMSLYLDKLKRKENFREVVWGF